MTHRSSKRVVLAVAILSVLSSPSASAQTQSATATSHPFAPHVAEASRRFCLPEAWIWAVMRVESGGDPRAVSRAGAMGAMQVMPATWTALRARLGLGADAFDARDNILAGAAYLRAMYDRFGNVTAMLAAYNAGPGRYEDHARRGRPLPDETVAYLARLLPLIATSETAPTIVAAPSWRNAVLFAARASGTATSVPPVDPAPAARPPSGLFIRTSTQVSR
jgi:soluble lytic murein transglycosylase-like protein